VLVVEAVVEVEAGLRIDEILVASWDRRVVAME
jgi:hypothetical protein